MSVEQTYDLIEDGLSAEGPTRGLFLRRMLTGGGALLASGALLAEFPASGQAASAKMDVTILNAALILENLGKDFYAEALKNAALSGETKTFVTVVHGHEVQHAAFVKKALGGDAKPLPSFDFGTRTHSQAQVQKTAMALEGLCTEALVGVSPLITRKLLSHAGALLPVEAQHGSWISHILGKSPAPSPFNPKATLAGVKKTIAPLLAS